MSYVLQRCKDCGGVIDPDDDDYKEGVDAHDLCSDCNEAYRESL